MKLIQWILVLTAAVVVVVFAIFNREVVTVSFWPFPVRVVLPLYLALLAAIFAGFALGAAVSWLSQGKRRRQARAQRRRLARLERDVAELHARAGAPGGAAPSVLPTGGASVPPRLPSGSRGGGSPSGQA